MRRYYNYVITFETISIRGNCKSIGNFLFDANTKLDNREKLMEVKKKIKDDDISIKTVVILNIILLKKGWRW